MHGEEYTYKGMPKPRDCVQVLLYKAQEDDCMQVQKELIYEVVELVDKNQRFLSTMKISSIGWAERPHARFKFVPGRKGR